MKKGETFDLLQTIHDSYYKKINGKSQAYITCQCKCGKIKDVRVHDLNRGAAKSCGCKGRVPKIWINTKFKYYEVISEPYHKIINNRKHEFLDCKCVCGTIKSILKSNIVRNPPESCGCKREERWNAPIRCCNSCKMEKEINCFGKARKGKQGYKSKCKDCIREMFLLRKYNIRNKDYVDLLDNQDGKCAVCGSTNPNKMNVDSNCKYFAVDHCHKTGRVRGLLCFACNVGIGYLDDNKEGVQKALDYLDKYDTVA